MPAISKQRPEQAGKDPEETLRSARQSMASSDDTLGADAQVEKLWLSQQGGASDVASTDCDRHEFFSIASNYMPSECWTPTPWSSTGSRSVTPAPQRPSSSAASITKPRGRAESALSGLQARKAEANASHSSQAQGPHSARTDRTPLWRSTIQSEIDRGTLMRVIVRLPGERRTHILVRPTTRVGPKKPKTDCFSVYWGQDAEAMGPFSGRIAKGSSEPSNRRLMRVRRVFAERTAATSSQHASPSTADQGVLDLDNKSLKELVQVATGIPANQQKLTFGMRGPLDCDESLLHDCGLVDGSEIRLMLKPKAPKKLLQDSQAHQDESWQVEPPRADWNLRKPFLRTDTLEFTMALPRFAPRLIVNSWNSTEPKSTKPLLWRSMKSPVLCP
eukprot:TRINITY_DN45357_c0_g1_i1.p1 TRINITY_DN45357_c0_g1~~TRINITY_DN45357_c0_g1_i1.p1  ORF type:complete len:389 (+),score=53.16 TRINITY_DN45357_c0_g1_i1:31-1197(+)